MSRAKEREAQLPPTGDKPWKRPKSTLRNVLWFVHHIEGIPMAMTAFTRPLHIYSSRSECLLKEREDNVHFLWPHRAMVFQGTPQATTTIDQSFELTPKVRCKELSLSSFTFARKPNYQNTPPGNSCLLPFALYATASDRYISRELRVRRCTTIVFLQSRHAHGWLPSYAHSSTKAFLFNSFLKTQCRTVVLMTGSISRKSSLWQRLPSNANKVQFFL